MCRLARADLLLLLIQYLGVCGKQGKGGGLFHVSAGSRGLEEAYCSGPWEPVVFPGGGSVRVGYG